MQLRMVSMRSGERERERERGRKKEEGNKIRKMQCFGIRILTLNIAFACSICVAVMKSEAVFLMPSTRALAVSAALDIS